MQSGTSFKRSVVMLRLSFFQPCLMLAILLVRMFKVRPYVIPLSVISCCPVLIWIPFRSLIVVSLANYHDWKINVVVSLPCRREFDWAFSSFPWAPYFGAEGSIILTLEPTVRSLRAKVRVLKIENTLKGFERDTSSAKWACAQKLVRQYHAALSHLRYHAIEQES